MSKVDDEKIIDAVKHIGRADEGDIFTAKVISIDEAAGTMEVEHDGLTYFDVRLRAVADGGDGFVIYPKKNTNITVGILEKNRRYVMLNCSEVDKLIMNDGKNEGLVKVKELVKKLNAVEKDLNSLKSLITNWIPVASDGGAALKTILASWAGQSITPSVQNDLENKNVKH
jgi:hypothetical protein